MPKFKLTDEQYAILKWAVSIVMPAMGVLVGTLGKSYGWESTDIAVTTITAVTTFLGSCLMISSRNYNKESE